MKLGSLLTDMARRDPARDAVVFEGHRVSFAELEDSANRFANALVAQGIGYGDRVALYLPNCVELVVAMVGVVKMGAIFVPVSPRLAAAEVRFILEDCRPKAVLFAPKERTSTHEAVASLDDARLVSVGGAEAGEIAFATMVADADDTLPPPLPAEVEDCAIGYTSGTTGNPKGAIATHRNIIMAHGFINTCEWNLTEDERMLVATSLAHRTALGRLGNMLYRGATLVIMAAFDAAGAVDLIRDERITFTAFVPTILRMAMPEMLRRKEDCAGLRTIAVTGEVFPAPLKKEFLAAFPHIQLHTLLAQTEVGAIFNLRPHEQLTHPESCGRPVPGIEVRFVDEDLNDVPPGAPGEVLVRSGAPGEILVTRGYFERPEANAEAFIDGGWMRTGDICRLDADGFAYFVDRAKDMIVSGGLNIYSKEVEQCLVAHPDIKDAAVLGVPDDEFGEAVAAFVERRPGSELDEETVTAHCLARIASYKKPKYVSFTDAMPRTDSGKVIKGKLREGFSPP